VKRWAVLAGRVLVTAAAVVLAVLAGRWMWGRYMEEPWTRDGRVRADVVQVAPDEAGFVARIGVEDNQTVRRGDVLFVLDQPRYRLALEQAEANVASQRSALAEARREAARNAVLGDLVATETAQQGVARVEEGEAALAQALSNRDTAKLNLERTEVRAPVNGIVTNLELRPGDYLTTGRQALALVDTDTLRVEGYFEETKLPRIRIGDPVEVRIMGEVRRLRGHVQSISAGIEDRERGPSSNLLANVNPTFSWVRLAQRVPVRVVLDRPPADVRLISGRTATVTDLASHPPPPGRPWWEWRR
jgi:multidrug resistance efflux pump